MEVGERFWSYS